ncbi:MAG: hypothetical protein MUC33_16295 [Desulfobacterales bacterium]|nr:hypothetical protein [Desulfobacterales bacterium]
MELGGGVGVKIPVEGEIVKQVRHLGQPNKVRAVVETEKAYLKDFSCNKPNLFVEHLLLRDFKRDGALAVFEREGAISHEAPCHPFLDFLVCFLCRAASFSNSPSIML